MHFQESQICYLQLYGVGRIKSTVVFNREISQLTFLISRFITYIIPCSILPFTCSYRVISQELGIPGQMATTFWF